MNNLRPKSASALVTLPRTLANKALNRPRYDQALLLRAEKWRDAALEAAKKHLRDGIAQAAALRERELHQAKAELDRKVRRLAIRLISQTYRKARATAFEAYEAAKETAWARFREDKKKLLLPPAVFFGVPASSAA